MRQRTQKLSPGTESFGLDHMCRKSLGSVCQLPSGPLQVWGLVDSDGASFGRESAKPDAGPSPLKCLGLELPDDLQNRGFRAHSVR